MRQQLPAPCDGSGGRAPPTHRALIVSDQPIQLQNVIADEAAGRWFRIFSALVESGAWARLSDPACRVYVALAKHCGRGWEAWPSLATLHRLSGASPRRVCYGLKELEGEGLLMRRSGGGRSSTRYHLLDLPASPSLPFPVCDSLVVPPAAQQQCRRRHSRSAASGTGTRSLNKTSSKGDAAAAEKLTGIGVENAGAVVEKYGAAACVRAVSWAAKKRGIKNLAGFLLAMLDRRAVPDEKPEVTFEAMRSAAKKVADASAAAAERFYGFRSGSESSMDSGEG